MIKTLAELFIQNKGEPLNINGRKIVMSHQIDITQGQVLTIEFIKSATKYRQGIEISVDKRKGQVEINEEKYTAPVLWVDTAPNKVEVKCLPKKSNGQINIWNIWNYEGDGVDAWIGNAGMHVEQVNDRLCILHCSLGIGEFDLNDLIVKVSFN